MAASKQNIERWKKEGRALGATHIISVCDTFDHYDYPVYVMADEGVQEKRKRYDNVNMQRVNEVIEL